LHFAKLLAPSFPRFRGISIDVTDDDENALDSIRVNREFASNVIDESDLHDRKHDDPRTSTFRGITIDERDENENAVDSIRVICEAISHEIDINLLFALKECARII
jgi:hypothetical protein